LGELGARLGIAGSIGTVGGALDNALCESTISLFNTEAINLTGRPGPTDETSNGRSHARPTGTTPTGCTPRSGTCHRLSSNSIIRQARTETSIDLPCHQAQQAKAHNFKARPAHQLVAMGYPPSA
jgi:hypothetical protein